MNQQRKQGCPSAGAHFSICMPSDVPLTMCLRPAIINRSAIYNRSQFETLQVGTVKVDDDKAPAAEGEAAAEAK